MRNSQRPVVNSLSLRGLLFGLGFSLLFATLVTGLFLAWDYLTITIQHGDKGAYCTDGFKEVACGPGTRLVMLIPTSPYALIFGFIPAVIIGPLAGLLIGWLVPLKTTSESDAISLGTKITSVFSVLWLIVGVLSFIGIAFVAMACVVCVLLGRWLAKRLYRESVILRAESQA